MPSIVIRLDPEKLSDANLDLRYRIPEMLEHSTDLLHSEGYDYEDDTKALQMYLSTSNPDAAVPIIVELLQSKHPFGNDLAVATQIGVSNSEVGDATTYEVVFPRMVKGVIQVPQSDAG